MPSAYERAKALSAMLSALSDAANAGASFWNAYSAARCTKTGDGAVRTFYCSFSFTYTSFICVRNYDDELVTNVK